MNKRQLLTAFFIGSALVWQSCGNKDAKQQGAAQAPAERIVPVTTAVVNEEIVTGNITYPASVVALNETELRAEVNGYITNIFVADGAVVSKGQKLYEIDGIRYTAAVDQAKANLNIAQANYDRVQTDLKRYEKLAQQDAIAKQTLDYAKTDLANQQAQVASAKAALTTANTNLARSVIRAPFAGTVGISQVRAGALVSAGTTLLNTISSNDPIAVEIQVNEKDISKFTALRNSHSSSAISLTLPDGTEYPGHGTIHTVDRAIDPNTGTLKVRAAFNNANRSLVAGMNLTLSIKQESASNELVVPYKAVMEQLGVFNVYVVGDSSKAEIRHVELGTKIGDRIVIKKGITPGDKVIVEGVMNLQPGVKVTESKGTENGAAPKKG
ncbi:efflux RND transporter periplasmic adaptor subunit [Sphingobacterium spiritivorum]|uniref:Efflux transporter, RND family, MFP subunit n=1 Tax=Sphingobacterium spiritivorum ATCC 33861 TaxID=525373 RepID=D7VMD4_SPHSI|nr:efflux RND transporter periplasmic adaptor subunit [Sphingobacterium spiritivorum]EFK58139.1 efflux transporter, RND family, MFP subunit [Sphingobacterium spiritivorum ATCC 33861]QQT34603.1 efflux RND transporter periplasmic adaptor subunit [Sphingobacterium spiritivorum]WQD35485.1 efflux RND transporter periplasmic adaptor subunit [Sphingobacterium spiritivorum]SUJ00512.1 Acriflavine resistance protein A precursor [Sphingobacterium spiritivorum]